MDFLQEDYYSIPMIIYEKKRFISLTVEPLFSTLLTLKPAVRLEYQPSAKVRFCNLKCLSKSTLYVLILCIQVD
jgi:hypothetical protein